MTDFGRYRLSYEPGKPEPYSGVLEHSVDMSISGEATVPQLLQFFETFLKAAGYVFNGDLRLVTSKREEELDPWFSLSSDFVPFTSDSVVAAESVPMSFFGEDIISFNSHN